MDGNTDDHELAAAAAPRLGDARVAGDIEHCRRLAATLHALDGSLVQETDPAGTTVVLLPHLIVRQSHIAAANVG